MRLLHLTMSAFGTYSGLEHFDFEKHDGLYLINGDTGSGKSTIFDAVTFALYGETSGDKSRKDESLRSTYAKVSTKTFVELVIEHQDNIYTIHREPKQIVPKQRGSGTTVKDGVLEVRTPSGTMIKKEAERLLNEMTGLTITQWRQVVMLAQGQFMAFLNSDSKEREKILNNIFETERFETITEHLKTEYETQSKNCESSVRDIDMIFGKFKAAPASEYYGVLSSMKDKGSCVDFHDDARDLVEKIIAEDKELIRRLESEKTKAVENSQTLQSRLSRAEQVSKNYSDLDSKIEKKKKLESRKEEMSLLNERNGKVENVYKDVKPVWESLKKCKVSISTKETERSKSIEDLGNKNKKLEQVGAEISKLEDMKNEVEALKSEKTTLDKDLTKYGELDFARKDLRKKEKELEKKNALKTTNEKDIQELKEKMEEDNGYLVENRGAGEELVAIRSEIGRLNEESELVDDMEKPIKELGRSIKNCETLRKTHSEKFEEWESKDIERSEKEKAFLLGHAAVIAKELVEGEPCPVCGSCSHPTPAYFDGNVPTSEELELLRNLVKELFTIAENAKNKLTEAENKVTTSKEVLKTKFGQLGMEIDPDKDDLSGILKEKRRSIDSELKPKIERQEVLNEICERMESIRNDTSKQEKLKELEDQIKTLESAISEMNIEKSGIEARITELSKGLVFDTESDARKRITELEKTIASFDEDYGKAVETRNGINESIAGLNGKIGALDKDLSNLERELDESNEKFQNWLKHYRLADEGEYISMIELHKTIETDKATVMQYEMDTAAINGAIKTLKNTIGEEERPGDLSALREEYKKAQAYSESLISGITETDARIRDNGSNLNDLENAVERCKETIETAGIYRELYEAASGKTSRINFNQYVLGKYLDDITVTASERLKSMSGGRYEIIRKLENDDRRKMQALDFRIHDHDSEIDREINSLSGGESFMTSLSLALALSNTIQGLARGKTVEALFIDEGFGSLDETAINQAIRVLKGMSEGMSIGVISHVQRLLDLIEDHVTVKYSKGVGSRLVSE